MAFLKKRRLEDHILLKMPPLEGYVAMGVFLEKG